jgi:hypothetical protein
MKRQWLAILICAVLFTACGPQADVPATVAAAVAATSAALPTPEPQRSVVIQEATVVVEVTVVVTPTDTPTPAGPVTETPRPTGVTGSPQPVVAGGTPAVVNGGPDPLTGNSGVIFDEHFAPGEYWGLGDDESSSAVIEDEQLTLVNKKTQRFAWTFNTYKSPDFYMQAVVNPVNCKDLDNYGIAFRYKDDDNLLLFGVSCDGRYRLMQIAGGAYTPLVDWTASDHILHFNWINTLGARVVGDQVALYVNNYYLGSATTSLTLPGRFGLYVGNVIAPDLTVHFDDVTAWRIGQ